MTKRIIIATAFMAALSATAQETYFRGQNYADRFSVSPAFAGFNGNDEAFISYRRNMLGIEGALVFGCEDYPAKYIIKEYILDDII